MKLRLACVVAALFAFAVAAHAADVGKKNDDTTSTGLKKLKIPSLEMGGGSIGLSTSRPGDSNVPAYHDPRMQDQPMQPFVGLKFTAPLEGK
jgi:hypothetical protein